MMLMTEDSLDAQSEQFGEMVASITQYVGRGRARQALALIEDARESLAGSLAVVLPLLDVTTAVSVLGLSKARMHARLLRLEADVRTELGERSMAKGRVALARSIERIVASESLDRT